MWFKKHRPIEDRKSSWEADSRESMINQWACSTQNPWWWGRGRTPHPPFMDEVLPAESLQNRFVDVSQSTTQRGPAERRPLWIWGEPENCAVLSLVVTWATVSVQVFESQSREVLSELSAPAAFEFFLLLFEFGPESESLWESCFSFLRLWVRLSFSSLLSPELLSSSLPLVFAVFLFLCRLLVLFLCCLSLGALLSSLLLSLLEHSAFLRFSASSFFFFFFFFFREDFLDRLDKLASVSDLAFFSLWRPLFFVSLLFSQKKRQIEYKTNEAR